MAALEPGMSKKEILDLMPEPPLYIHSGDHQTSVWVYEWRLLEVKSEMKLEGFRRLVIPKKTDDEQQHQRITTEIFLTFDINDKLLACGAAPYEYPIPAIPDNSTNDKPFTLELKVEGNQDGILTIEGAGN